MKSRGDEAAVDERGDGSSREGLGHHLSDFLEPPYSGPREASVTFQTDPRMTWNIWPPVNDKSRWLLYLGCSVSILSGRFRFPDNDCLGHLHVWMLLLGFLYCDGQSLQAKKDNQNNTRLHQKRMFHSQEPRLHNNLFQLITFQTRNSSLHLAPDKQAIWTGTGSSPNRELLK
ncbi:unnamed protein product [Pleuronectes platessa]|uniref:Uncharacterized protein n=1 Tax=Pleuronectes platessa TaxID=8262 RepID=A0A9N7YME0_PLEPL|nr:unnamed protein product [Pleuronectes platessa]